MYLKSVNATDVYGNKVILGADEIIRCYKKIITDFMETRFFWIFQRARMKSLIKMQFELVRGRLARLQV